MKKITMEVFDVNTAPSDSDPKQVFAIGGDEEYWETARYVRGRWIDHVGNEFANVVLWCEIPHPSTFADKEPTQ